MEFLKVDYNFNNQKELYRLLDGVELPPDEMVKRLRLTTDLWGVYDEKKFVGTIVVIPNEELKIAYILLGKIYNEYSLKDFEAKIFQEIIKKYDEYQLMVSIEMIDKNASKIEQIKSMLEKNGYVKTNLRIRRWTSDYDEEILCNDTKLNIEDLKNFVSKTQLKDLVIDIYPIEELDKL